MEPDRRTAQGLGVRWNRQHAAIIKGDSGVIVTPALEHLLLRALQATGQQQALERCCAQGRRQLAEVGEMLPERWDEFVADPAA